MCVQLLDAGLRELEEETGLRLGPEELSPTVLGLWEVRQTGDKLAQCQDSDAVCVCLSVGVSSHAVQRASPPASRRRVHAAALVLHTPAAAGNGAPAGVKVPSLLFTLPLWCLQAVLHPSPAEVSACVWADKRLVRAVVSAVDGEDGEVRLEDLPGSVRCVGCAPCVPGSSYVSFDL